MPSETCPTCGASFEVAARVEMLMQCPRCAGTGVSGSEAETWSGEAPARVFSTPVPFTGEFLERYQPARVLGKGGFAVVYLAHARASGRAVAVKFLTSTAHEITRKRFEREMELLASLEHENIVELIEYGEMGGLPYLVCEYLDGGTLRAKITAHARLSPAESLRVICGVLAGLSACHARGVVHRDVKPENIMFSPTGCTKLTDLGLAKDRSAPDLRWTAPNSFCGTPYYMSPEQIRGEAVGPASDVYACGVVLYEMLCGAPPFDSATVWDLFEQHVRSEPPPIQGRVPYVPDDLAAAVHRALAKSPEERFADASGFLALLAGFR